MMAASGLDLSTSRTRLKTDLEQQQQRSPWDLRVAHSLGLLCFWQAGVATSQPERSSLLHTAALNLALVIENDVYWQQWVEERAAAYGIPIDAQVTQGARESLRNQLLRNFTASSPEVEDAFRLEVRAIRLLQQAASRSPAKSRAPACGPLLARQLRMHQEIGQFVAGLQTPAGEWAELLERLRELMEETPTGASVAPFDAQAKGRLMAYFSQLAYPALYLDQKRPLHALDVLTRTVCPECVGYRPSSAASSRLALPRTCSDDCPQFAENNPAFYKLANRAATLWQHAVDLAVEAYLLLAEQCLAASSPHVESTICHWQDALEMAGAGGNAERLHSTIADMAIIRATALEQSGRSNDAISLLDATLVVSTEARLRGKLAEVLTNRGVMAGNSGQWEQATVDLRRAYALNPHVHRTRDNLVTALRGHAAEHYHANDFVAARPLLQEAIQVLNDSLARTPTDATLRTTLMDVEGELSTVNGAEAALSGDPLALLLALLGGVVGPRSGEATPSPPALLSVAQTRLDELRQSATSKAQRNDFEGAVADLEEALRQAPNDDQTKHLLASILEQYADDLMAHNEYGKAQRVAERGLSYAPGHAGLLASLTMAQMFGPIIETPSEPVVLAEPVVPTRGLRAALSRLFGGKDKTEESQAPPSTDLRRNDALHAHLQKTSLKFTRTPKGDFHLPFTTRHVGQLMVRADVSGDMVTLTAPLQSRISDEAAVRRNLLHATFEADFYKSCQRGGSLTLDSQILVRDLSNVLLEDAVRGLASLVDVSAATLNSPTAFAQHAGQLQAEMAMNAVLSGGAFQRDTEQTVARVADLARRAGMRQLGVQGNRVRLALGMADLKVQIVCKGQSGIAIAYMSGMSPRQRNIRLMRRMAEINAEMAVCKVALDNDDDTAFMYHLPAVDDSALEAMRSRIEECIMRYGFELAGLAK
jgi:tetratricopeptide (TPR) repeat protein